MTDITTPVIDWDAVRLRYEGRDEQVTQIATSIGITQSALSVHAREHGWQMRKPVLNKSASTIETLRRLKEGVQKRLLQFEDQMAHRTESEAALSEADMRNTSLLLRNLEKVLELENKQSQHKRRRAGELTRLNDAQRDELARRIAGLLAGGGRAADQPRAHHRRNTKPAGGVAPVGTDRSASP